MTPNLCQMSTEMQNDYKLPKKVITIVRQKIDLMQNYHKTTIEPHDENKLPQNDAKNDHGVTKNDPKLM